MKKTSGYSIIELLIVLVIMSSLFVAGYTGYREFARRQALDAAIEKIKSDLMVARQTALSGTKSSVCGTSALEGFIFGLISYDENYYWRMNGPKCSGTSSSTVTDYRYLPAGEFQISVNGRIMNGGSAKIIFKTLNGTLDSETPIPIIVTQRSTGDSKTIVIKQEGVIE